ncbi:MAG: cation:proton antiporter, partial [Thermodesulfobacteria bacterium]|nr:cation:proton antiporter [Thermodesulfobacteriota bacterium]NPB09325.1 cation:proton antiporter [Thermodesulfobacteriota bacterium]
REKIFVGLAMIPRGEVGIIFAEFGRLSQIFDQTLYTIMIAVVAFTTLAAPFLLKFYVKKARPFDV